LLWYVNMGEDLSEIVEYWDKYASFVSITLWQDTDFTHTSNNHFLNTTDELLTRLLVIRCRELLFGEF
jgi:hypothetical protein